MSRTYYIDAVSGCDGNSGLTQNVAWQTLERVNAQTFCPGDRILFRAGQRFCGQLWPKGDGAPEQPITVGKYGEGALPCIDAGGSHGTWEGNYNDGAALLLFNQNYWDIEDLEITNFNRYYRQGFLYFAPDGSQNVMTGSANNRYRYGVLIRWDSYGVGHHVHLRRLNIHDVNGEMQRFCSCGIMVICTGLAGADLTAPITKGTVPTNFDDVLIEDCTVCNIDRTGIAVWSQWAEGRNLDYPGNLRATGNFYHTTVGEWTPSTNFVLRGCKIIHTAGDGVLINSTKGALVEHNYVQDACYEMRIGPNAAVWPHNADGTVMQYNEICHTHGVQDGQAFDIDLSCNDTTIQYNYTHDNEGGFLLIMDRTTNNIIRFNISINDRNGLIWYHYNEGVTQFYNNTFYIGMEECQPFRGPYDSYDWKFVNNLFFFRVPTEVQWKTGANYISNAYVNCNVPVDDTPCAEPVTFENILSGEIIPQMLTPDESSPLKKQGTEISDNGGLDYMGKNADMPFIGAIG